MAAFLANSKGSCEPPIFLELSYDGADQTERPIDADLPWHDVRLRLPEPQVEARHAYVMCIM